MVLQVAGDAIAQVFIEKKNFRTYDYVRSTKFALFGVLNGLVIYKWYSFLDEKINYPNKFKTVMFKLAGEERRCFEVAGTKILSTADQLIFAPLFILVATGLVGFLQEYKFSGITNLIKRDFRDLIIAEIKVWPAVQFVNFYFIPLSYQLGFNSVFALAWNTYFCAKTYRADKKAGAGTDEENPAGAEEKPADVEAPV